MSICTFSSVLSLEESHASCVMHGGIDERLLSADHQTKQLCGFLSAESFFTGEI